MFTKDLNSGVRRTLEGVFPRYLWRGWREGMEGRTKGEEKEGEMSYGLKASPKPQGGPKPGITAEW